MLSQLWIKNILLFKQVHIEFNNGLSVFTGDTGAGKSILLASLSFIIGGKPRSKLVRPGCEWGQVTASFSITPQLSERLDEVGLYIEGDELIIRRQLYPSGKSKAFVNDQPVSITLLQNMAPDLIEIQGQHDQKFLLNPRSHITILDSFGNYRLQERQVADTYKAWQQLESSIVEVEKKIETATREADYLQYVLDELEAIAPEEGEEEKLVHQRILLLNKGKISETLTKSSALLEGSNAVSGQLIAVEQLLTKANQDEIFSNILPVLAQAIIEVEEARALLGEVSASLPEEEGNIDVVEERLYRLRELARKHKVTVDELPKVMRGFRESLEQVTQGEGNLQKLRKAATETKLIYEKACEALHQERVKVAKSMESKIKEILIPLKMAKTQFQIICEKLPESAWSSIGFDQVKFLLSTNPGIPPQSLEQVASGGELSRFLLALKSLIASEGTVATLVFDEIDTGVSGEVADAVGKKLVELAVNHQLFVVTHQPQVAAQGEYHFHVSKESLKGETETTITLLSTQARIEAIAKMISGATLSDEAVKAAEQLMQLRSKNECVMANE